MELRWCGDEIRHDSHVFTNKSVWVPGMPEEFQCGGVGYVNKEPIRMACPSQNNHEEHFWKYDDDEDNLVRKCFGRLSVQVDIFTRPKENQE
jgi:hypothetical protein